MPRLLPLVAALGLALLPLASPPAHATLVRSFTLAELTTAADAVLVGEVTWQEATWDPTRREVYTRTAIRVRESWRGTAQPGDTIILQQLGGTLDAVDGGLTRRIVGTAALTLGDELVLFARSDGALYYAVGMAQGVFQIRRPAGRPTLVQRGPLPTLVQGPVPLVPGQPGQAGQATSAPFRPLAPDEARLAELRAAVQDILASRPEATR